MTYKEQYILNFINNDSKYRKIMLESGYTIEHYLDSVRFLYWNDLIYRINLTDCENIDQSYKLDEYAKFLIYVYIKIVESKNFSQCFVRQMHIKEYNWHRYGNVLNNEKLFFLM